MLQPLTRHPDNPCHAVTRIEASASRGRSTLSLRYIVTGAIDGVLIPPSARPDRTDELWKHTCFEVFIRAHKAGEGSEAVEPYIEFNFSPSTQWAAYSFARRRSGMRNIDIPTPAIRLHSAGDRLELEASVDLSSLPDIIREPWLVGLTTIIEEISGDKSYWALAHPQGKPDFHAPEGFALQLPAAGNT